MKAVSLFSGIGGFDLGLERAGIETILQVEIDPFCRRVLEKHWPNVRRIADVRDVTAADCEGADLIYGGFPCQPVSLAGARKGKDDERWLWPEFARLIGEVRPTYAVMENVPGLVTAGLESVIGDLTELGYDAQWDLVPAAALGAAHLRYRIFIVAYANRESVRLESVSERRRRSASESWDDGASGPMADAYGEPLVWAPIARPERHSWSVEPDVGRVADGVPARVDRLRALGNAVVPQVAEYVGRRLLAFDAQVGTGKA